MVQKLFTELRTLYSLNWGKCNVIRMTMCIPNVFMNADDI